MEGGFTLEGADCWGITLLALQEFGVDLDDFAGKYFSGDELGSIIASEKGASDWKLVEEPTPGTVVLMKSVGVEYFDHIGVYIGKDWVLHTHGMGSGSCINRLRSIDRAFKELEFYEHTTLNNNPS